MGGTLREAGQVNRPSPLAPGRGTGQAAPAMDDRLAAIPSAFAPAELGPLQLRNRVIKAATFEGVMPRGAVTDELISFHRAVAAGGVGMTTVAYGAVSPGGRVNRNTL